MYESKHDQVPVWRAGPDFERSAEIVSKSLASRGCKATTPLAQSDVVEENSHGRRHPPLARHESDLTTTLHSLHSLH